MIFTIHRDEWGGIEGISEGKAQFALAKQVVDLPEELGRALVRAKELEELENNAVEEYLRQHPEAYVGT